MMHLLRGLRWQDVSEYEEVSSFLPFLYAPLMPPSHISLLSPHSIICIPCVPQITIPKKNIYLSKAFSAVVGRECGTFRGLTWCEVLFFLCAPHCARASGKASMTETVCCMPPFPPFPQHGWIIDCYYVPPLLLPFLWRLPRPSEEGERVRLFYVRCGLGREGVGRRSVWLDGWLDGAVSIVSIMYMSSTGCPDKKSAPTTARSYSNCCFNFISAKILCCNCHV